MKHERLSLLSLAPASGWRALLLSLCVIVTVDIQAKEETISIDSTETPPIWSSTLAGGGMGGELLHQLSEEAGVRYTLNYLPPARFRRSSATVIVGNPNLLTTERRRAIFPLSIMHLTYFHYLPHHEPIRVRSLEDLRGHTLGLLRGTIEDRASFESLQITIEEADSVNSLLQMLKRGRIDVAIVAELPALFTIQQLYPDDLENFVHMHIPGASQPIALMVDLERPRGPEIAQRYRRVLDSFLHSQRYMDIIRKYHAHDLASLSNDNDWMRRLLDFYEDTWDE